MIIVKKKIRNLERYTKGIINTGEKFCVGLSDLDKHKKQLITMGFSPDFEVGERVLPWGNFGSITRFNAEGKYIKRKDLPMETAYREAEWHWKTWNGEEHSDIIDVPYKRYPRKFIAPPSVELQIVEGTNCQKILVSDIMSYTEDNYSHITHTINVFLEIFGECDILTDKLNPIIRRPNVKYLNWTLLPPGKYPWEKIKERLDPIIDKAKKGHRPILTNRFEIINKAKPDFHAIGKAGFNGYIVFGFTERNLYIVESAYYGNATYIFEDNWERLSQLTKAQILNNQFQKDRIVHQKSWYSYVKKLLA